GFAEQVFPCDDPDDLPVLDDRDTGDPRPLEYLQDIVAVPRDLDVDHVGCHKVPYNHVCYDLTTRVETLLWVTINVLALPMSNRSVWLLPWEPTTIRSAFIF